MKNRTTLLLLSALLLTACGESQVELNDAKEERSEHIFSTQEKGLRKTEAVEEQLLDSADRRLEQSGE